MDAPNTAAPPPDLSEGLWLSIAEIARIKGVSRQAVSKRVASLEADGAIMTRPGPDNTKLVNVAQYNLAIGALGDAAKELGFETRADDDAGPAADDPTRDPTYRQAQAREKQYSADLKKIELDKALGSLVDISLLADHTARLGEAIVQVIDRLPQRAGDMAAAVGREGAGGARAQYKRDAREIRAAIVDALQKFVEGVTAKPAEPVVIPSSDAPLWGDLDPAKRDAEI